MRGKRARQYRRGGLAFLVVLALFIGSMAVALSAKLNSVQFQSSRTGAATHLLIVALDARPGGDSGLPDSLVLLDLSSGQYSHIPRNWSFSLIEPSVTLVEKYLGQQNCQPFCGIQGVYAFSKVGIEASLSEVAALDALARVVETEYGLQNVAVSAFDLTWAYSFLSRVSPLQLDLREPIPVGGTQTSFGYEGVKRFIEPGLRDYYGGDLYWIARARFGSNNESRMDRQLQILNAILQQRTWLEVTLAAWGAKGFVLTDIQLSEISNLLSAYQPQ